MLFRKVTGLPLYSLAAGFDDGTNLAPDWVLIAIGSQAGGGRRDFACINCLGVIS